MHYKKYLGKNTNADFSWGYINVRIDDTEIIDKVASTNISNNINLNENKDSYSSSELYNTEEQFQKNINTIEVLAMNEIAKELEKIYQTGYK